MLDLKAGRVHQLGLGVEAPATSAPTPTPSNPPRAEDISVRLIYDPLFSYILLLISIFRDGMSLFLWLDP